MLNNRVNTIDNDTSVVSPTCSQSSGISEPLQAVKCRTKPPKFWLPKVIKTLASEIIYIDNVNKCFTILHHTYSSLHKPWCIFTKLQIISQHVDTCNSQETVVIKLIKASIISCNFHVDQYMHVTIQPCI